MIISDSHEFVFLHNPKAAGTTVRHALKKWDTRNNFYWGIVLDRAADWNVDKAHLPLHVLGRLFPSDHERVHRYFSFGFSRHPVTRFISAFHERFPEVHRSLIEGAISLDEYASKLNEYCEKMLAAGQWNPSYTHATPQFPLFYDGVRCAADLVIPIENPQPKLNLLARLLSEVGVAVRDCLAAEDRRNERKAPFSPGEVLSPASLKSLEQFYERDYEAFGYASKIPASGFAERSREGA